MAKRKTNSDTKAKRGAGKLPKPPDGFAMPLLTSRPSEEVSRIALRVGDLQGATARYLRVLRSGNAAEIEGWRIRYPALVDPKPDEIRELMRDRIATLGTRWSDPGIQDSQETDVANVPYLAECLGIACYAVALASHAGASPEAVRTEAENVAAVQLDQLYNAALPFLALERFAELATTILVGLHGMDFQARRPDEADAINAAYSDYTFSVYTAIGGRNRADGPVDAETFAKAEPLRTRWLDMTASMEADFQEYALPAARRVLEQFLPEGPPESVVINAPTAEATAEGIAPTVTTTSAPGMELHRHGEQAGAAGSQLALPGIPGMVAPRRGRPPSVPRALFGGESWIPLRQDSHINAIMQNISAPRLQEFWDTDGHRYGVIESDKWKIYVDMLEPLPGGIRETAVMLLDILTASAMQSQGTGHELVRIPLRDFMLARGLKDVRAAREQIDRDMKALERVTYCWQKDKRPGSEFVRVRISGGFSKIENGVITFRFTPEYVALVPEQFALFPTQAWKINTNTSPYAYAFVRHLAINKRMNIGKGRADTMGVEAIIKKCATFPKYDDLGDGMHVYARIIKPFEDNMNALASILSWEYVNDPRGGEPRRLTYAEFIKSKVRVSWTAYPDDKVERLVANRTRGERIALEDGMKRSARKRASGAKPPRRDA